MKNLAVSLCVALAIFGVSEAIADDTRANTIEGAYLLLQDDGYQRILSFDVSGNVMPVSDQQPLIGFSSGQGTWKYVVDNKVVAKVIDFTFTPVKNKPTGPASIVYRITFSEPADGKYHKIEGNYVGENFDVDQNPLAPEQPGNSALPSRDSA